MRRGAESDPPELAFIIPPNGRPDFQQRRCRARQTLWRQPGGGERIVATAYGFPCADGYINLRSDTATVGVTLRLYAVLGSIRTLEAKQAFTFQGGVTPGGRISASGRGCDSWEMTAQVTGGAPSADWSFDLLTFDGTSTVISVQPNPGGGAAPGVPTWSDFYGFQGVIKAASGNLLQCFGFNAGANTRYVQIFDAAAVPADGATPVLRAPVAPGSAFQLTLTDPSDPPSSPGRPFTNGISWAISSTPQLKTVDAAATFDLHAKSL